MNALRSALLLLALSCPAAAAPFPWDKAQGSPSGAVAPAARALAEKVLSQEFCYAGCADTYAQCMTQEGKKGDTARRVAGMILRQAAKGRDEATLKKALLDRARSAQPASIATFTLSPETTLGAATAPLTVVEFADFQCPYCQVISPMLERLVKGRFAGQIRWSFKGFPVKGHERAVDAMVAALAAGRQGKFFEYHDLLYQNRHALAEDDLVGYARALGLDLARFAKDRADPALLNRIREEKREGLKLGVERTPTLFLNGKLMRLADLDEVEIIDRLEEALAGAKP